MCKTVEPLLYVPCPHDLLTNLTHLITEPSPLSFNYLLFSLIYLQNFYLQFLSYIFLYPKLFFAILLMEITAYKDNVCSSFRYEPLFSVRLNRDIIFFNEPCFPFYNVSMHLAVHFQHQYLKHVQNQTISLLEFLNLVYLSIKSFNCGEEPLDFREYPQTIQKTLR